MQGRKWYTSLISIAMSLGIVFALLLNLKPGYIKHHPEQTTVHTYMTGVHATRFDAAGDLAEKISIEQLSFNEHQQETTFLNPKLTRYQQNLPTWALSADNGTGYHKKANFSIDHILLHNNVKILQLQANQGKVPWRLATNELELNEHIARTDQAVLIKGPGLNTIESQGLKADFIHGEIQLLHNVASVYDKKAL